MKRLPFPLPALAALSLALGACGRGGGGPNSVVLAEAVVGPDGGGFVVTGGSQAGLRLEIPAGALTEPVTVRAVAEVSSLGAVTVAPTPGLPLRFEPEEQVLLLPALLVLPYRVDAVTGTAPGDVRARHTFRDQDEQLVPAEVDVDLGLVSLPVTRLGRYLVVANRESRGFSELLPRAGTLQFDTGATMVIEAASLPGLPGAATRWSFDDGTGARGIYLTGFAVAGRFDAVADLQEIVSEPLPFGRHAGDPPLRPSTTVTRLYTPIGASRSSGGGVMSLDAEWDWSRPLQVGSIEVRDALELRLLLQWDGAQGRGGRDLSVLLSPTQGVVAILLDGVPHVRTGL